MHKVVVKFLNGTERSGSVLAFNVNLPALPLNIIDDKGRPASQTVNMNSVKVVHPCDKPVYPRLQFFNNPAKTFIREGS